MNKLTAIKSMRNGSDLALNSFVDIWSKFIKYWDIVRPMDNITKMVLELV